MSKRTRRKTKKVKIIERKLGKERAWGLAWQGFNTIEIDERLRAKSKLIVYVHELLHLADVDMPEYRVERISQFIGKGLWQANYRKVNNK